MLRQNEKEANIIVAKVMRITFVIFTLVYIMNVMGIFEGGFNVTGIGNTGTEVRNTFFIENTAVHQSLGTAFHKAFGVGEGLIGDVVNHNVQSVHGEGDCPAGADGAAAETGYILNISRFHCCAPSCLSAWGS